MYSEGPTKGLGVVAYVALIAGFIFRAEAWFGPMTSPWGPMLFLLILVLSAAITGTLVFGRPAFLALQGNRSEALHVLATSITVIVIAAACIVIFIALS
jgi:hypothetical protein